MYLICHTPRVITNLTKIIVDKNPEVFNRFEDIKITVFNNEETFQYFSGGII